MTRIFRKVLVANRGEIAVRILRTLRELEIPSVAVYSEADAAAPHVELADEAWPLGAGPAAATYLDGDELLRGCAATGADALHPGYGFLSENAAFARACAAAGVVFVGPPPAAIEAMGVKTRARELMQAAGIPIVPGTVVAAADADELRRAAEPLGYPVAVKAAGGGGGRGFRIASSPDELADAFAGARGEGERFFGSPDVYLERYFPAARHIEVQVAAGPDGDVVHLGERDCSVQRRHQKLIEEAPAPGLDALRGPIGDVAVAAARAVGYRSLGTVEGLVADGRFYFLEMNTRLQVEHTVTEMVTGLDLVKEQLLVAAGRPLSVAQEQVSHSGCAIQFRINAEDPERGFLPSPGTIARFEPPAGPGVRVDAGVRAGSEVSPLYDSLIAKLVVWGPTREEALATGRRALDDFHVDGVETTIPFHRRALRDERFLAGEHDTGYVAQLLDPKRPLVEA